MKNIGERYFDYLLNLCNLNLIKYQKYDSLFEILHNIEFIAALERDENRIDDGLELRDQFVDQNRINGSYLYDLLGGTASVFEVLVALSLRLTHEYVGTPGDEHPDELFMDFIQNLRLEYWMKFYDVEKIINIWMDRNFSRSGYGSPFPLNNGCDIRDQRYIEIWDQAIDYINKRYFA